VRKAKDEKAHTETDLVEAKKDGDTAMLELEQLANYNEQLHKSCEHMANNFEVRQTARDEEDQQIAYEEAVDKDGSADVVRVVVKAFAGRGKTEEAAAMAKVEHSVCREASDQAGKAKMLLPVTEAEACKSFVDAEGNPNTEELEEASHQGRRAEEGLKARRPAFRLFPAVARSCDDLMMPETMEISDAAKSGDGSVINVGIKMKGQPQCSDCRLQLDTEGEAAPLEVHSRSGPPPGG
jgi:hypothetical protein